MNERVRNVRRERVKKMNAVLRSLYPRATIALNYSTPWELLVAVILSAQCTDARVNTVTKKLFKTYRTVSEYAELPQIELERAIFSCGFYRNKARHIRNAAIQICERHDGQVPSTMSELISIPGVGRKTANVILSTLYGKHDGIAVDTHVRRFAIRFDLTDHRDPAHIERDLMDLMPRRDWWGFNHRLVHYGRDYCPARKHDCSGHPLTKIYLKAGSKWPRAK